MGLYETLSKQFLQREVEPYGSVLIVPSKLFKNEWQNELSREDIRVYQGAYDGQTCFFLKAPTQNNITKKANPTSSRGWSREQEEQLRQLLEQGLSYSEIANRLGKKKGAVIGKAVRMRKAKCEPARDSNPEKNPDFLNEFLEALTLLYQHGHRRVCLFLLKNSFEIMKEGGEPL